MKYKYLNIINTGLLAGIILFLSFYLSLFSEKEEYVYVDNVKLFNGFHMAKDVSEIHNAKINTQVKKVDSLYQLFQLHVQAKDEKLIKVTQLQLQKEDKRLSEMKQHFSTKVSQQVWGRLNTYIKEYGKNKEFKIILGTQGNGTIVYAQDLLDVTDAVLDYANLKYEGN